MVSRQPPRIKGATQLGSSNLSVCVCVHGCVSASSAELHKAQSKAAVARSSLQEALQQLHRLEQQLQNSSSAVEETSSSARDTNQLVTHVNSAGGKRFWSAICLWLLFALDSFCLSTPHSANEVRRKVEEAELRTERLLERVEPLSMLGETLSRNLSDIRDLINQARRQAASVPTHSHTHVHTQKAEC